MIIKKLEIENFGKLSQYKINFNKGIQVVYGRNEYGKSTIMEFIKMMFYGDMGKSVNSSMREIRIPWTGGKMGGAIEFIHNNKIYRLQKEFDNKTPSRDKIEFKNISDYRDISLGKKQEVGEMLFGLDLTDFERIGYISCVGSTSFQDGKNAKKSMINLINTGDEDVSKEESEKNISNAIKELKWKNGAGGKIVKLENDILKLKEKIYQRKNYELQQTEIKNKISELDKLIGERNNLRYDLETRRNLDKIEKIKNLLTYLNERNELRNYIKAEDFSYDYCKDIFFKCKDIEKEIKNLINDIKELKKSLAEDSTSNITKNEVNNIRSYDEKKCKIESALSEIKDIVLPECKRISNSYLSIKQKLCSIKNLNKVLDNIKSYQDEYETIKNKYDIYMKQSKMLETKLEQKSQELDDIKKDFTSFKNIYRNKIINNILIFFLSLFISIFLSIVSKGCLLWNITPLITTFLLGYLVYILIKGKKQKSFFEKEINEIMSQINLIDFNNSGKCDIASESYKEKISQLEFHINKYQKLKQEIYKLENEEQSESKFLNILLNNLKIKLKNIYNKLEIKSPIQEELNNVPDLEKNINIIINNLKAQYNKIIDTIKYNLINKNCENIEEYLKKYDSCLRQEGLIELLENKTQKLDGFKEDFFKNMSVYKEVRSVEDAINKLNLLGQYIEKESEINNKIKIHLNSLGIKSENISDLKSMVYNLQSNINENINYNDILKFDISSVEKKLKYLENQKLDELKDQEKEKIVRFPETIIELEEKLQNKIEELKKANSYLKSLELAKMLIEESYNELMNKINPQINDRSSYIFRELTEEKYDSLYIQDNFNINIKVGSLNKKHNIFSSGTIDQAYLSLRIALSEAISKNASIPILMDDVLMRYDDKRLELTLNFLKNYIDPSEEGQIIIFTCHRRIIECGMELNIPFLELH